MTNRNVGRTKYQVGDWVTFDLWPERGLAQVIELRGPLAHKGEQMYRLRYIPEWGDVREFEQRESDLEPAEAPSDGKPLAK